jgi:hypothetical protein
MQRVLKHGAASKTVEKADISIKTIRLYERRILKIALFLLAFLEILADIKDDQRHHTLSEMLGKLA